MLLERHSLFEGRHRAGRQHRTIGRPGPRTGDGFQDRTTPCREAGSVSGSAVERGSFSSESSRRAPNIFSTVGDNPVRIDRLSAVLASSDSVLLLGVGWVILLAPEIYTPCHHLFHLASAATSKLELLLPALAPTDRSQRVIQVYILAVLPQAMAFIARFSRTCYGHAIAARRIAP